MVLYWKETSETGCCFILASSLRNSVSVTSCLCHSIKHTRSVHTDMCVNCSPHYPYTQRCAWGQQGSKQNRTHRRMTQNPSQDKSLFFCFPMYNICISHLSITLMSNLLCLDLVLVWVFFWWGRGVASLRSFAILWNSTNVHTRTSLLQSLLVRD